MFLTPCDVYFLTACHNTTWRFNPIVKLYILLVVCLCSVNQPYIFNVIVEFPAVLLNTLTGVVESEFHYYVMPEEQPMLSDFCKQLTGITQVKSGHQKQIIIFNVWILLGC